MKEKNEKGSVTVLLLCILLPLVMFLSFVMDCVRSLSAKRIASDASSLAVNGALADYDTDLKQSYGLFALGNQGNSVSEKANKYYQETISPVGTINFIPMSAQVQAQAEQDSALSNTEIYRKQILDFVQCYAPSTMQGEEYLFYGLDNLNPMIQTVSDKFNYDIKLYESFQYIQEAYNWLIEGEDNQEESETSEFFDKSFLLNQLNLAKSKASELDGLWEIWNTDVSILDISDGMRSYMTRELAGSRNLLTVNDIQNLIFVVQESETSEEILHNESISYIWQQCSSQEIQSEQFLFEISILDMLDQCNVDRFIINDENGLYPIVTPSEAPKHRYITRECLYGQLLEETVDSMRDINNWFLGINTVREMVANRDETFLIEEYATEMFGNFLGTPSYSLSGNKIIQNSVKWPEEVEYLIYGKSDALENERDFHAALMGYSLLFCLLDNFSDNENNQLASKQMAHDFLGTTSPATPLIADMYMIAYGCRDAEDKVDGIDQEENNWGITLRRRDLEIYVPYKYFLKLFLLIQLEEQGETQLLERMRKLSEMNLQSRNPRFCFENAYTKITVHANVHTQTQLLQPISFQTQDSAGY